MRILVAHLKLLYEDSELWHVYAIFAVLACLVLVGLDVANEWVDMFAALVLGALAVGFLVGAAQGKTVLHPMCCLFPGGCQTLRRVVFAVGAALSFVMVLLFVASHGGRLMGSGQSPLMFLSVLSVFGVVYLLGAMGGLSSVIELSWLVPVILMMLYYAADEFVPGCSHSVLSIVIKCILGIHPVVIIVLGIGGTGAIWRYFGRLGLVSSDSDSDLDGEDESDEPPRRVNSRLSRFILNRVAQPGRSDRWKYAWGTLYMLPLLGKERSMFLRTIIAIILMGYFHFFGFLVLMCQCMDFAEGLPLPIHSRWFPTAGRRERQFAMMFAVAVVWVWSIILSAGVILGTDLLACVAPDIVIGRFRFCPTPVDPTYLWLPLVLIPIRELGRVVWHESPPALIILGPVGVVVLFILTPAVLMFRTSHVVAIGALAWILLGLVVRWSALQRDLVKKQRG